MVPLGFASPAMRACAAFCLLLIAALPSEVRAKDAEWTVMIYMNAKNNLEPYALKNFHDIAEVGSTEDVNILVEMP